MRDLWRFWDSVIPEEEVNNIIKICETFDEQYGTVFADDDMAVSNQVRRSKIRWANDSVLRSILWSFIQDANRNAFDVDVVEYADIQYTEYHGDESGKYDEHIDVNWGADIPYDRKLSITVQLSDPDDYTGGDFTIQNCDLPAGLKNKGSVLVFPSYLVHGVSPVQTGIRKSLVAWFEGPRWR